MKYLFLSLLLLSVPAHADKIYSNRDCRQMYRDIMMDFAASKVPAGEIMAYYGEMCIPGYKDNPARTTMREAVLSNELVVAIKAKLAEQDLIKL